MADENRKHQVSLGCGTLILIAIIVLIFSGRRDSKIDEQMKLLRTEVSDLRRVVESQTAEIRQLQQDLKSSLAPRQGASTLPSVE